MVLVAHGLSCNSRRRQAIAPLLDISQVARKTISTGECHPYVIQRPAGQYLRLKIGQHHTDTQIYLQGQPGSLPLAIQGREDEFALFSLIFQDSTHYRLKICSAETEAVSGNYEITILEAIPATLAHKKYIGAEASFLESEKLKAESKIQSSRLAIMKYEETAATWRSIDKKEEEAIALKNLGQLYHQLGEPQKAMESYDRALSLCETTNDIGLKSEILSQKSGIYVHLGKYQQAKDTSNNALESSRRAGDERREALSLNSLGEAYYGFGDRWKALECNRSALMMWEHLGNRRGAAETLLILGSLYEDIGDLQKASEYYNRALAIWQSVHDRRGRALALTALGGTSFIQDNHQKALDLYGEARQFFEFAGEPFWAASVVLNIGAVYQKLGDNDKALSHFNEAYRIWRGINNPPNEAAALSVIGWAYYLRGEYRLALSNLRQALSVSQAIDDKKYQSNVLRKIGVIYQSLGRKETALIYYNRALMLHRSNGERRSEASALSEIGKLFRELKKRRLALRYFHEAIDINRATGDQVAASQTLFEIASVERDLGQLSNARFHIEQALAAVESVRSNVSSHDLRASYYASIQKQFEFHINLLMLQHERQPANGFAAEAFRISENTKARNLLELLAESRTDIRKGADPALIKHESELRQRVESLAERKERLLGAQAPDTEVAAITNELEALISERDQVEAKIRFQSPFYAFLTGTKPLDLQAIQQSLDDKTLLLEYYLGNERSYLWAITQTEITSYILPGREKIEDTARQVYSLLSSQQLTPGQTREQIEERYWKAAQSLSEMILAPVTKQIHNTRLLIVSDGMLQYLPFQALPAPELKGLSRNRRFSAIRPLVTENEIVNLPSASTLVLLRKEKANRLISPKTAAVLADPVFEADDIRFTEINDQPGRFMAQTDSSQKSRGSNKTRAQTTLQRLYWSKEEVEAIKSVLKPESYKVWTGFEATRTAALSADLARFQIVHFATHGQFDSGHPDLSSIVFSLYDRKKQRQDGYLRLHDIYNMNLHADLVVLSACETALGKEIKGEGLVGLTRGFMYAGAARVMASLWKVEDRSTAELMKRFYRLHLKERLSASAALQKAQIEMWKSQEWHAPYHWAGFVLQGEFRDR